MQRKITGYIIKTSVYQETNLIVSCLTCEGIISFKAKAALKVPYKLAPLVQLFTYGEFVIAYSKEESKNTLIDGHVLESSVELSTDFESQILLSFVAESIVKDEAFERPFEVFSYVFNNLKNKEYFMTMVAIILKYHMQYNGSYLEADGCVKCGSNTKIQTVSFNEGGYVCASCNSIYHIEPKTPEYMKIYRYVMKAEIENSTTFIIPKTIKNEFMNDLFSFVEENSGLKFNSKQMILEML